MLATVLRGLVPGVPYRAEVAAATGAGVGARSAPISIRIGECPMVLQHSRVGISVGLVARDGCLAPLASMCLQHPQWSRTWGQWDGAAWRSAWPRWRGGQPSSLVSAVPSGSSSLGLQHGSTAAAAAGKS